MLTNEGVVEIEGEGLSSGGSVQLHLGEALSNRQLVELQEMEIRGGTVLAGTVGGTYAGGTLAGCGLYAGRSL